MDAAANLQQQLRWATTILQMQHAAANMAAPPAVPPTVTLTPPNENSPPQGARQSQQPTTPPGEQIELRQFLLQMLQEDGNRHLIRWTNKEEGMFKLVNKEGVAKRWGEQTGHPGMNYEKMSRTLRFNYTRKTIEKGSFQVNRQFEYRFINLPELVKSISPKRKRRSDDSTTPPTTPQPMQQPLQPLQPLQQLNMQQLLQIQQQMLLQRALLPLAAPLFQFLRPLLQQQPQPPHSPQQFSIEGILGLNQSIPEDVSDTSSENVNVDSPHTPPIVEEFEEPEDDTHSN